MHLTEGKDVRWIYTGDISHTQVVMLNEIETIVFTRKNDTNLFLKRTDLKLYNYNNKKREFDHFNLNSNPIVAIGRSHKGSLLFSSLSTNNSDGASFYPMVEVLPQYLPDNDGNVPDDLQFVVTKDNIPVTWFYVYKDTPDVGALFTLYNQTNNKDEYFIVIKDDEDSLLHANGYTKANDGSINDSNQEVIVLNAEKIFTVKEIFGRMMVFSDKGSFALNKDHIYNIYGDDNFAWFWIKDDKLEHGDIYIREKVKNL